MHNSPGKELPSPRGENPLEPLASLNEKPNLTKTKDQKLNYLTSVIIIQREIPPEWKWTFSLLREWPIIFSTALPSRRGCRPPRRGSTRGKQFRTWKRLIFSGPSAKKAFYHFTAVKMILFRHCHGRTCAQLNLIFPRDGWRRVLRAEPPPSGGPSGVRAVSRFATVSSIIPLPGRGDAVLPSMEVTPQSYFLSSGKPFQIIVRIFTYNAREKGRDIDSDMRGPWQARLELLKTNLRKE